MTSETATRLAKQAQVGDAEALSHLVDALRMPLFAVAYRQLRHYDDAQDAVANALIRIIKYLPRLRDPEQVQAWAARIARNEARRLRRPQEIALPDDTVATPAPSSLLRLDIERELRRLPRQQARACVLFYFGGQDVARIAQELGRPEGTIKYWLHQVRGQLRARLQEDYIMKNNAAAMETTWTALIAGNDFAPAKVPEMEKALHRAGWDQVYKAEELATVRQVGKEGTLLADCQLVVLGEQAGGRSAFELCASWRGSKKGQQVALFLIADGNRPEDEFADTAMAAYVAGFDMLLGRPFDLQEFEQFAHRIRTMLDEGRK